MADLCASPVDRLRLVERAVGRAGPPAGGPSDTGSDGLGGIDSEAASETSMPVPANDGDTGGQAATGYADGRAKRRWRIPPWRRARNPIPMKYRSLTWPARSETRAPVRIPIRRRVRPRMETANRRRTGRSTDPVPTRAMTPAHARAG